MALIKRQPLIFVDVRTEEQRGDESHGYYMNFSRNGDQFVLTPERPGQGQGAIQSISCFSADLEEALHLAGLEV